MVFMILYFNVIQDDIKLSRNPSCEDYKFI